MIFFLNMYNLCLFCSSFHVFTPTNRSLGWDIDVTPLSEQKIAEFCTGFVSLLHLKIVILLKAARKIF